MIASIRIEKFQSIARAQIALGPWTSLVGESDVGKSAVIRAVYAALTNMRGDHFIRYGEPACEVTITMDDGAGLHWVKARGKSGAYMVTRADGSYMQYEKTNSEVPAEVADLLRVSLAIGDADLMPGVQRQHDPPFLFADTARRRAQILGEFDGSNLLLVADGDVRRIQREAQGDAAQHRTAADHYAAEVEGLLWVDAAQEAYTAAKAAVDALPALYAAVEAPTRLLTDLRALRGSVASLTARTAASDVAATAEPLLDAGAALDHVQAATVLLTAYRAARATVGALTANRPDAWVLPRLEPIVVALNRAAAARALLADLQRASADVGAAIGVVALATSEVAAARAALLAVVGEACPLCGAPLTAESFDHH